MRIVVHGQQAFGKAVLEGCSSARRMWWRSTCAPEKPGAKADPLKEAALAAKACPSISPDLQERPRCGLDSRRSSPTCR